MQQIYKLLALGLCVFPFGATAQSFLVFDFSAQPNELMANAGPDQGICATSSTSLAGSLTGGTAPFTYQWSPSTNLSATNIANPVATPTATTAYMVTVTDSNGCTSVDTVSITVFSCTGITSLGLISDVVLFPNPSDGNFRISFTPKEALGDVRVEIVDVQGKTVFNGLIPEVTGEIQYPVSLSGMAKGNFFIRLLADEKEIYTGSVIIQ